MGLVYIGDGAMSTGAFHEGINFAAVQRCPLVVICENNGYAYSTPTGSRPRRPPGGQGRRVRRSGRAGRRQRRARGVRGHQGGGRARPGRGRAHARRTGDLPPEGPRRARQPELRAAGEIEQWEKKDPLDRYGAADRELGLARGARGDRRRACSRKSTRRPTSPSRRRRPSARGARSASTRIRRPTPSTGTGGRGQRRGEARARAGLGHLP